MDERKGGERMLVKLRATSDEQSFYARKLYVNPLHVVSVEGAEDEGCFLKTDRPDEYYYLDTPVEQVAEKIGKELEEMR